MQGTITNFRRSRHVQKPNHMIILVEGTDTKEKAEQLIGKEVVWKSPAGKEIKGKIAASHGTKGAVRAIFDTGMPGQALSGKVDIK